VGGGEFAVLLVDADPACAEQLRDRARGCMPGISVSVGAATASEAMGTPLTVLLEEADRRMYEEKRAKRRPATPPKVEAR
jgi:GGDEF domain-containing protein